MSYPKYVEHWGEQVIRPPLALSGATIRAYVLRADPARLRAIADLFLGEPSQGLLRYEPIGPYVVLAFAVTREASPVSPEGKLVGGLREIDVAFWIPLRQSGERAPPRCSWFLPYVFVDSGYAITGGRELYGFRKALATFQIPDDLASTEPLTVDTIVVHPLHPSTHASSRRIIEVTTRPTPGGASDARATLGALRELVRVADPRRGLFSTFLRPLSRGVVQMVFLKQFRDAADGTRACYQAIVEGDARVTRFRGGGVLPGLHRVLLHSFDSLPMAEDLGVAHDSAPIGAFWLDIDFVMESGVEVFRSR